MCFFAPWKFFSILRFYSIKRIGKNLEEFSRGEKASAKVSKLTSACKETKVRILTEFSNTMRWLALKNLVQIFISADLLADRLLLLVLVVPRVSKICSPFGPKGYHHCLGKKTTRRSSTQSTLEQKPTFYPEIHILKFPIFTKFTLLKSHFSQNSHFWNLIFHKIHIFKISFFTKFTFPKSHFSQNSHFSNIKFLVISGKKGDFCPSVVSRSFLKVFQLSYAFG